MSNSIVCELGGPIRKFNVIIRQCAPQAPARKASMPSGRRRDGVIVHACTGGPASQPTPCPPFAANNLECARELIVVAAGGLEMRVAFLWQAARAAATALSLATARESGGAAWAPLEPAVVI
jgi:hypothetical protein